MTFLLIKLKLIPIFLPIIFFKILYNLETAMTYLQMIFLHMILKTEKSASNKKQVGARQSKSVKRW